MVSSVLSVSVGLTLLAVMPGQVGGYLQKALWFVVVVGVLVFVHELGHFLVAKRAGVGVLKFSLGFGPKLLGFRRGETEYLISAIPLGGYVKMVGEDPADRTADPAKSFQNKSVGWRSLVVLAGPGSNVILSVVLFAFISYAMGQPTKEPVVGSLEPGSVAEKAGLRVGDQVLAVDGDPATNWEAVLNRVEAAKGQALTVSVQRGTERLDLALAVTPQRREVQGLPAKVARVVPGEAGDRAGMKPGDKVVAFNGEQIEIWPDLVRRARRSPSRPVSLTVERSGRPVDLQITPGTRPDETGTGQIGYLGIEVDQAQEPVTVQREEWNLGVGPRIESIPVHRVLMAGLERTWWVADLTLRVLGRLATGDISPKAIGGPLYIAAEAGKQAKEGGLLQVVGLMAILSVNLAILNLLPVPILDGGHLLFFLIEAARGGPVSLRKREIAQQVGLALLVALMVFAFYNDIFRILGRH